ncbi:hypothetical protein [Sphingomonas xanthus]|uniref:hypothetical protein n=1 Tax=Sphingomonas xanthus TaxID=2594473 RepID=UPI00164ED7EB|nr:hypothetical protein [Sphingomonas xanthus]
MLSELLAELIRPQVRHCELDRLCSVGDAVVVEELALHEHLLRLGVELGAVRPVPIGLRCKPTRLDHGFGELLLKAPVDLELIERVRRRKFRETLLVRTTEGLSGSDAHEVNAIRNRVRNGTVERTVDANEDSSGIVVRRKVSHFRTPFLGARRHSAHRDAVSV